MAQAFIQTNTRTHAYIHSIHILLSMHEASEKLPHTHEFLPFVLIKAQFRSVAINIMSFLLLFGFFGNPSSIVHWLFCVCIYVKNIVLSTTTLPTPNTKYDQSLERSTVGLWCFILYLNSVPHFNVIP